MHASAFLPEPWPPCALAWGGFFSGSFRSLRRDAGVAHQRRLGAERAYQARQELRDCPCPHARLVQACIEIGTATDLDLDRMNTACRLSVAVENISSRIGPVVRHPAAVVRQIPDRKIDQPRFARRAEPIADYELGRLIVRMRFCLLYTSPSPRD